MTVVQRYHTQAGRAPDASIRVILRPERIGDRRIIRPTISRGVWRLTRAVYQFDSTGRRAGRTLFGRRLRADGEDDRRMRSEGQIGYVPDVDVTDLDMAAREAVDELLAREIS